MSQTAAPAQTKAPLGRYFVIGAIIVIAFFVSYRFALARTQTSTAGSVAYAGSAAVTGGGSIGDAQGAGAGGAACNCGGSGSSTPIEGSATLEGAVQKINVDLSSGSYNPNVINLKAGVPAEITFGQGTGCLGEVESQALGFSEDLSSGPKTVRLPALQAGTYEFSCGMQMVFGSIVVK
jgi:hypothetical protein